MLLIALLVAAVFAGDIEFSRTITDVCDGCSLKIEIDHGCSKEDAYGSNDCSLNWGDSYKVDVTGTLPFDIDTGAKMDADLKVSVFPWKFSCMLCGETCEITVPIVGKKIPVPFPDCPVSGQSISRSTTIDLPATSPVPIQAEVKGSIQFTDQNGKSIAKVALDAKLTDVEAQLPVVVESLLLAFEKREVNVDAAAKRIRQAMRRFKH